MAAKSRLAIPLYQLYDHPKNPRKQLQIEDLTDSLAEVGQLVPLLVRPFGNGYEIISGHRRRAALDRLGTPRAECDIIEMSDEQAFQALMVTNIQAQTLTEIEEAEGIRHMLDSFEWTVDRVAKEFGKARRWVFYRLDLLGLNPEVQDKVHASALSATHGREIAQLPQEQQAEVAQIVIEEKLSTRETSELVKKITKSSGVPVVIEEQLTKEVAPFNPETGEILDELPEVVHAPIIQTETNLKKEKIEDTQSRIKLGSDLLYKFKEFYLDIQAHDEVVSSLIEFDNADKAIIAIDKTMEMLNWLKLRVSNAKGRTEGVTIEGKVVKFKKKEA